MVQEDLSPHLAYQAHSPVPTHNCVYWNGSRMLVTRSKLEKNQRENKKRFICRASKACKQHPSFYSIRKCTLPTFNSHCLLQFSLLLKITTPQSCNGGERRQKRNKHKWQTFGTEILEKYCKYKCSL